MLSNFKLFSKSNNENVVVEFEKLTHYKIIFVVFALAICVFIYFKRAELNAWWSIDLSDFVGKMWLNSHLTSAGELASTYVPKNFFENNA